MMPGLAQAQCVARAQKRSRTVGQNGEIKGEIFFFFYCFKKKEINYLVARGVVELPSSVITNAGKWVHINNFKLSLRWLVLVDLC